VANDQIHLAAATNGGPIYTSADGGVTWTAQNSGNAVWTALAISADGTHLVAATSVGAAGQLYVSLNSGVTWTVTTAPSLQWAFAAASPDDLHLMAIQWSAPSGLTAA
jgi:photosystem II stability/assembly factor-like uncharacterized protein